MSDEFKKLEQEIQQKIHVILDDTSISTTIQGIMIDILENHQEFAVSLYSLRIEVNDIKQSLNDPEAHKRR